MSEGKIPASSAYRYLQPGYMPNRMESRSFNVLSQFVLALEANAVPRETDDSPPGDEIESDLQVQVEAAVRNPNLVRRVLGQVKPEDVNTRLAIWRAYEDDFIDAGIPIPDWMEDLRREIYARAPVDFRSERP